MKKILFILLLVTLPLTGCGKGNSGTKLIVTTDTPLGTPSAITVSKPLLAATGDGTGDTFDDQIITPSGVTLGLRSFKFFRKADTDTVTPGQTQESYSVLDLDPTVPHVVKFQTGVPEQIVETVTDPKEGTYDRVEFEITYFEMVVPLCNENNICEDRRLRFYLTSLTDPELGFKTTPLDLLISRTQALDFVWISSGQGLPNSFDLFPITGTKPSGNNIPIQIPATQLGTQITPSNPSIFTAGINPNLVIPRKPKGKFVFTLNFKLDNLFFFDNANDITIDPSAPFHFNALVRDPDISKDGKIRLLCSPLPAVCTTSADFYPSIPEFTLEVHSEDSSQSTTGTTTTTIPAS